MECLITNNSNQLRSNLLKESKRALLARHQDAYPTNRIKAMYSLVGYEDIKTRETKNKKSSVVFLSVPKQDSNSTTDVFKCWHCNQEGHSCMSVHR